MHQNPCRIVIPQKCNYQLGIHRTDATALGGIHIFKALIHHPKLFSRKVFHFTLFLSAFENAHFPSNLITLYNLKLII